jgi:hypothetical protein
MEMFRLVLPQLVGVSTFLLLVWLIAFLLRRYTEIEQKPLFLKGAAWITFFALLFFALWVGRIASVNNVPRSVIDRSAPEYSKDKFEERMEKAASQPKVVDSNSVTSQKAQ